MTSGHRGPREFSYGCFFPPKRLFWAPRTSFFLGPGYQLFGLLRVKSLLMVRHAGSVAVISEAAHCLGMCLGSKDLPHLFLNLLFSNLLSPLILKPFFTINNGREGLTEKISATGRIPLHSDWGQQFDVSVEFIGSSHVQMGTLKAA